MRGIICTKLATVASCIIVIHRISLENFWKAEVKLPGILDTFLLTNYKLPSQGHMHRE